MLYMNINNAHYLYIGDCCIAVPFLYNCYTDISFAVLSTNGSMYVSAFKFYDIDVNGYFGASFAVAFHLTCKLSLNTCSQRSQSVLLCRQSFGEVAQCCINTGISPNISRNISMFGSM